MGNECGLQGRELTQEFLPPLGRGDELVRRSPRPEVVSKFVEGVAEALGRPKTFKAQHRIGALFDSAMILLDPIIFIAATPMFYFFPEHFGGGSRIGAMPVGGDLFGTTSRDSLSTAEKTLGSGHVSLRTERGINQLSLFVNRPI